MARALYTVVGQDGKEYGPTDIDTLCQWVSVGGVRPETVVTNAESGERLPAQHMPELAEALAAVPPTFAVPPVIPTPAPTGVRGSHLIPSANPPALIGYYVGVAALIPCLGLILGPVAIFLGLSGLRKYRANPQLMGRAHAWVAIALGALCLLFNLAGIVYLLTQIPAN